jgi:hypothetical protein
MKKGEKYYIAVDCPEYAGYTCVLIEGDGTPGVDEGDCIVRLLHDKQPQYSLIGNYWLRPIPAEE